MWLNQAKNVHNLLGGTRFSRHNRIFNICLITKRNQSTTIKFPEEHLCCCTRSVCGSGALFRPSDRTLTDTFKMYTGINLSTLSRHLHTCTACQQKLKGDSTDSRKRAIVETHEPAQLTLGAKVQQAGRDVTYTAIVIVGIAVTGIMFYAIGRELFSGQSPSGIYDRAFKLCEKHEKLYDEIGHPMKAYGETTSRGRRRFVRHQEYEMNGVKYMRLKFYIEGPLNKGTVHLEAMQDNRRKYQFRYIFVELENHPRKTIIIEDNR